MRALGVGASLLLVIGAALASSAERPAHAEGPEARATVKRDGVPVYAQMATRGEVLAVLEKGVTVRIDFALIGSAGGWCRLVMDGLRGYVRCEDLDREPRRKEQTPADFAAPETTGPPDRSLSTGASTAPAAPAAPPCQAWLRGDEQPLRLPANMGDPTFWVCALRFTAEQMARARELAERTGLLECGRRFAARSSEDAPTPRTPDAEADLSARKKAAQEWYSRLDPGCRGSLLEFWKEFPDIMTPEQRAAFDQALATARHQL